MDRISIAKHEINLETEKVCREDKLTSTELTQSLIEELEAREVRKQTYSVMTQVTTPQLVQKPLQKSVKHVAIRDDLPSPNFEQPLHLNREDKMISKQHFSSQPSQDDESAIIEQQIAQHDHGQDDQDLQTHNKAENPAETHSQQLRQDDHQSQASQSIQSHASQRRTRKIDWQKLRNFRVAGFAIAFPFFLQRSLDKKVLYRFIHTNSYYNRELETIEDVGIAHQTLYKNIRAAVEVPVSELAATEEHLDFVDNVPDEETRYDNYDRIVDATLEILHAVIESTQEQSPYDDYHLFVAFSSFERCYFPDAYAFPFEYSRMEFSKFGSLFDMNEQKTKMLIGGMVLIRTLVMRVLLRAEEAYRNRLQFSKNASK